MKVALIHDYLTQRGGAEKVLESFSLLYPEAPIFTLVYDKKLFVHDFSGHAVHDSFLNHPPFSRKKYRYFSWLMPLAIEQFDLSQYDLIISSSVGYAKGVIPVPGALHVSYCHTLVRYAWDPSLKTLRDFKISGLWHWVASVLVHYVRWWDRLSAARVDFFVANSNFIAQKIRKYYRREARVIYPPLDTDFFTPPTDPKVNREYFLAVGRFVPYKKIDLIIRAFLENGLLLRVVGSGPQEKFLKKIARKAPNIIFEKNLSAQDLRERYRGARALVVPQVEDFGIATAEAAACGTPVIAYKYGGSEEIVKDGVNGVFFLEQSVEALNAALARFEKMSFHAQDVSQSVQQLNKKRFLEEFSSFVKERYAHRD